MSAVETEPYAEYSDSGIEWLGRLPESWRTLRLKDVIEKLESGVSVNASDEPAKGNNIGVLKTSCVGKDCLIPDENKSVWPTELDRVATPVRAGRIIVSRMNTPQLVGASAYVPKDYPNLFLPDRLWQTVFYSSVKLDSKWLSLLIGCKDFRYLLSKVATGTSPSMKNLGQDKFLSISIPFPSPADQTGIAAYLDAKTAQLDRKIDLLNQKATQYGKLKQSLINETVTRGLDKSVPMKDSDVVWIGGVPEHWDVRRGKDIFEQTKNKAGVDSSSYDVLSLTLNGVIKRDLDNMKGKIPGSFDGYQIANPGDLVLCLFDIDVTPRIVGHVNNLGIITSAYTVIKGKKNVDMKYFLYYYLEQNRNGSLLANSKTLRSTMTFDLFSQLLLPVPPLEEQRAIANYLDEKTAQIDRIVTAINTQIDKLKDLRKALINDVVTGKIKVVSEGLAV